MSGPDCPTCLTPMDGCSTWNEWEYECRTCHERFNRAMERKSETERPYPTARDYRSPGSFGRQVTH